MVRHLDFFSSLPIDSNIAFLEFPTTVGRVRYVTIHTWKTGESFLVNIGIIDKAELIATGEFFAINRFVGLDSLQIWDGVVSVGHDDDGDIAKWRVANDAEVLLYRYAVSDYPSDVEAEDWDARAVQFVETLGTEAELVDYKRLSGTELQELRLEG